MTTTKINRVAADTVRGSNDAKTALAYHFKVTVRTIENWCDNYDVRLTTPDAVAIIKKETGLKERDILDKSEAKA